MFYVSPTHSLASHHHRVALTIVLSLPVLTIYAGKISSLLSTLGDFEIWNSSLAQSPWATVAKVSLGLAMTFVLMVAIWEMFVPLGRLLGRYMADHPKTIWAYSINVGGSLAGIWFFVFLSAWEMPPFVWLICAGLLLSVFFGQNFDRKINWALVTSAIVVAFFAGKGHGVKEIAWSPYQKLSYVELEGDLNRRGDSAIMVNNTGYQGLYDLRPETLRKNPQIDPKMYGMTQYDVPLLFHPNLNNVLIVGTGSGNDVTGAVARSRKKVTGVEIDPAIIEMGRRFHPERPYDSPNVRVVNDDARSFFATTTEQYDLIIFGLLDSHTSTAMTNARLDHYVYTRESIARARDCLSEGGVMFLSFEAAKPFIADRMARCIKEVFGSQPLTFRIPESSVGWGGANVCCRRYPFDKSSTGKQSATGCTNPTMAIQ